MKMKVAFTEMTLPACERRQRNKRMARIVTGSNPPTKRQIRRLPSNTKRKARRALKRILRKQNLTMAEVV